MSRYSRGARAYYDILGVRATTKVGNHCSIHSTFQGLLLTKSVSAAWLRPT